MNAGAWAAHNAKRWTRQDAARFARPGFAWPRKVERHRLLPRDRAAIVVAAETLRDGNRLLKGCLAEFVFANRLARLQRKDWEDQPRAPAGSPEGGQWVDGGGSSVYRR